jgi:hypothetical protein
LALISAETNNNFKQEVLGFIFFSGLFSEVLEIGASFNEEILTATIIILVLKFTE